MLYEKKKIGQVIWFCTRSSSSERVGFESKSLLQFLVKGHESDMASDFKARRGIETHFSNEAEYD